jgi:N-acylneuraminate cytidylyltransferase
MRVAIIPARGGSKRIPRKNIKPFLGKPIMAYPLEAARASGLFDHIVVSTDDEEVARIAVSLGAEVPFCRPPELSDDQTGTEGVLMHAVGECVKVYGPFGYGCCIYPANPLLRPDDLERGLRFLEQEHAASAFPVVRYDFPIEQALTLVGDRPVARWPAQIDLNSQDLAEHYHDAGSFYWLDVARFMETGRLLTEQAVAFPLPAERVQDINTPEDWRRAELKFRIMAGLEEL